MRFLAITVLGFATAVLANDIVGALNSVKGGVNSLNDAVSNVKSHVDKAALEKLSEKSNKLNEIINAAKTKVEGVSPLGAVEAVGIAPPAIDLAGAVGQLSANLATKKEILEKAGSGKLQEVVGHLEKQKEGNKGLSDAVLSKLPGLAKPVAENAAEKVELALQNVIAAFNKGT